MDLRVVDFGAEGNAHQDDTEAFEGAIRQIHAQGGGRLIVTGASSLDHEVVYNIRPINLTSHMELYIEAGARIQGIVSDWPIIPGLPSYGQGRNHMGPRHTSLIHGEHLMNVTIRGQDSNRSRIDGNGEYWWKIFIDGNETITRGSLVEFLYSSNIRIYNITLMNSPFWTVHPYDCDDVHIQNVHILNPMHTPNTVRFQEYQSHRLIDRDVLLFFHTLKLLIDAHPRMESIPTRPVMFESKTRATLEAMIASRSSRDGTALVSTTGSLPVRYTFET
jgi:polygalacturonase